MAVSLGAVAAKAAKSLAVEAARDPGKFAKICCGICIGVGGGLVVITTLLSGTVSSFFGESLFATTDELTWYPATQSAITNISDYEADIMAKAQETKEEIIEKNKVTASYYFSGEEYMSELEVTNRANDLKEEYSQEPDLVKCEVHTSTTIITYYTISGTTPDGRGFIEDKQFTSEEEVDEYVSKKFQFGYKNLTSSKAKEVYSANFQVDVITCEIEFEENWQEIPTSYILAYLSTQTWESEKLQAPISESVVIMDFLGIASPLKTDDLSEQEEKKVSFWNETMSPEALALELWPDEEMKRDFFLASQKSYASMLGEKAQVYVDFDFVNVELAIPDYYQNHYKHVKYGNGTISSSGCGPTCIAMLATYFKGTVILPPDVCSWCEEEFYVPGAGTAWSVFPGSATHYGYNCTNLGMDYTAVLEAVASGKPVVASMGPGTFTSEGHYILLVGMTDAGELIINDPNEKNLLKYKTDRFSSETVLGEAKNFWSFSK